MVRCNCRRFCGVPFSFVMTTFAELGVIDPILRRLEAKGIAAPFEIQELTIRDAIDGRDILGKAKTGSGKTIAFGIPLVQRMKPGLKGTQALVLVPTRELCSQVADELRWLSPQSARVVAVYGGTGMGQQLKEAPKGHIIVATPGRLMDLMNRGAVKLDKMHTLVIDEADRMADMGFLPQVQWILGRIPRERQTMLFSATLDAQIMGLIAQTSDAVRHEVAEEAPTVETVEHHLFEVHQLDKVDVLLSLLKAPRELTLVFTRTKYGCDKLARQLRDSGIRASAIHGNLRQGMRESALDRFERGKIDVLVATDVAARGLDIDGITQVVNFDPPDDHKNYIHRVGRTARAGRSGVGITLALYDQREDVERMARRLRLHPHIVEVFSSDPRLAKVGTADYPGIPAMVEDEAGDGGARKRSGLTGVSRRASTRRRRGGRGR